MARSRIFERASMPYLIVSQTVPLVALVTGARQLAVALGSAGHDIPLWVTAALLGAFLAFFPIAVAGVRGLHSVKAESIELLDSYGASWRQGCSRFDCRARCRCSSRH
jgi:NitT/TauT family transport system permease protein